ncbi:acyltransferase family protein [Sphingomonas kaistensis]|uniref:Acyltransferase family protein n=1 Tax=Sphingomonas kaistensis TaxID=298708 RepID=A0ABZ2G4L0_9SPHN
MDAQAQSRSDAAAPALLAHDRTQWVDVARGLGIILVVWGHALRAHFDLTGVAWAAAQDRWIYSFHMPLFFLLAGLFLWRSIGKGKSQFLKGRWSGVIWPYLLWSFVCGLIELSLANYVTSPIGLREVLLLPFVPIEQFWFLYALLICQLICLALFPSKAWLWLFVIIGLGLLQIVASPWIGFRALIYLPFVAVGLTFTGALKRLAQAQPIAHFLFFLGAFSCLGAVLLTEAADSFPRLSLLLTGIFGSVSLMALSMLMAGQATLGSILGSLGRASLAIFVLHTLFSAGTRIAFKLVGVAPENAISFGSSVLAGLTVPWLIYLWARRRRLLSPLGFGSA